MPDRELVELRNKSVAEITELLNHAQPVTQQYLYFEVTPDEPPAPSGQDVEVEAGG